MTHFENTAEGQASGTTVTAANSGGGSGDAFNLVSIGSPGTLVYSNADKMHGTQSYLLTNGGTGTVTVVRWSGLSATQFVVRFYVKFNTLPGSGLRLLDIRTASTSIGRIVTNASNQLLVQDNNGGTTLKTFGTALSAGTWYRIEYAMSVSATATVKVDYYVGDSGTPVEAGLSTTTANTGTTAIAEVDFGSFAGISWTGSMYLDDLGIQDGTLTYLGVPSTPATVTSVPATSSSVAVQPTIIGEGVTSGGGPASANSQAVAPAITTTADRTVLAVPATSSSQSAAPVVTAVYSVTVTAQPAVSTSGITAPAVSAVVVASVTAVVATSTSRAYGPVDTITEARYLFTPPSWQRVQQMERSLRYSITTSTCVYRLSGVWHNVQMPGMDDPVVADCDVDPDTGMLLFFTTPTPVPASLYAEMSADALTPADPSWAPGSLALI